jgi:hypothetical protein
MKHMVLLTILSAILGQGVSFKSLYLFHIFAFINTVLLARKNPHIIDRLYNNKRLSALFLFLLVYPFVSLLWTDPINKAALVYLYGFSSISFALIYALLITPKYKQTVKQALLLGFYANAFISVLEILTSFRYPLSVYSKANWIAGRSYSYLGVEPETIPTGFFWNPNDYGTYLCCMLPLFFVLHKSAIKSWVSTLLCFILILFIQSRTSFIVGSLEMITLAIIIPFYNSKLPAAKKALLAALSTVIIGITLVFALNQSNHLSKKFDILFVKIDTIANYGTWGQLKPDSENKRLIWVSNMLRVFPSAPVLGHGSNAANQNQIHSQFQKKVSPHFFFLELLTNFGLIWMLPVVSLYVYGLFSLIKNQSYFMLISAIAFPLASLSMSSCIFAIPLFTILGFCFHDPFAKLKTFKST